MRRWTSLALCFTSLLISLMGTFFTLSLLADISHVSGISTDFFLLNHQTNIYQTNRLVYGGAYPQAFPKEKSGRTFRVFVFGGSSVAFMKDFLELKDLLHKEYPDINFEIINAGVVCYGTTQLLPIIRETVAYSPDLFIYYGGHNEFLDAFLLSQAWINGIKITLRELLHFKEFVYLCKVFNPLQEVSFFKFVFRASIAWGRPLSLSERKKIYFNYESNINKIVSISKENGVPIMLSTVAYNYVDDRYISPLFHSVQHKSTKLSHEQRPIKSVLDAELLAFPEKSKADPYIQNRLGKFYLEKRSYDQARQCFIDAAQNDYQPFRANIITNEIIRKVSEERGLALAEVEEKIVQNSPQRIPGFSLFVDWCHLNDEGKTLMQLEFFEHIKNVINSFATDDPRLKAA